MKKEERRKKKEERRRKKKKKRRVEGQRNTKEVFCVCVCVFKNNHPSFVGEEDHWDRPLPPGSRRHHRSSWEESCLGREQSLHSRGTCGKSRDASAERWRSGSRRTCPGWGCPCAL